MDKLREVIIPPKDESSPATHINHRHNFDAACTACVILGLQDKVARLKAENEELRTAKDNYQQLMNSGEMRRYEISQENNKLREALEEVEFISDNDGDSTCPWCCNKSPNHDKDCQRQEALKGDKP